MEKINIEVDIVKSGVEECTTLSVILSDLLDSLESTQMKAKKDPDYTDKVVLHDLKRTMPQLQVIAKTLTERLGQETAELERLVDF
ncbi:hypothetical protein [Holzapfeliella sp. JNUCC 72]